MIGATDHAAQARWLEAAQQHAYDVGGWCYHNDEPSPYTHDEPYMLDAWKRGFVSASKQAVAIAR
jgi:hypothetical protein